jgi:hypothetical protein
MDWITVPNFKADFAVAARATPAQAEMAIAAAEDELVELVGQSVVDDTLSASPSDTVRANRVVRAHTFLAASIQCLNVKNVKREQDAASPATSQTINNEYWNPKEIAEMRENWRSMALKAIGPYLLIEVSGDEYDGGPEFALGLTSTTDNDCCLITNYDCG